MESSFHLEPWKGSGPQIPKASICPATFQVLPEPHTVTLQRLQKLDLWGTQAAF